MENITEKCLNVLPIAKKIFGHEIVVNFFKNQDLTEQATMAKYSQVFLDLLPVANLLFDRVVINIKILGLLRRAMSATNKVKKRNIQMVHRFFDDNQLSIVEKQQQLAEFFYVEISDYYTGCSAEPSYFILDNHQKIIQKPLVDFQFNDIVLHRSLLTCGLFIQKLSCSSDESSDESFYSEYKKRKPAFKAAFLCKYMNQQNFNIFFQALSSKEKFLLTSEGYYAKMLLGLQERKIPAISDKELKNSFRIIPRQYITIQKYNILKNTYNNLISNSKYYFYSYVLEHLYQEV